MKVDKQLYFLATSSIVVLGLGTFGFYQYRPDAGLLTSIYLAVQLFSMNSGEAPLEIIALPFQNSEGQEF